MRWPWRRRGSANNGAAQAAARAAAESEAKKRAAEQMTPIYERLAEHVAALPPEEFVERVARMFGRQA